MKPSPGMSTSWVLCCWRTNGRARTSAGARGAAGASECALLLAKASNERQQAVVGTQTGGRVGFFLHTDDFWRDYRRMAAAGVSFSERPREEAYGTVVVFEDLYGNRWDLLQLKSGV